MGVGEGLIDLKLQYVAGRSHRTPEQVEFQDGIPTMATPSTWTAGSVQP